MPKHVTSFTITFECSVGGSYQAPLEAEIQELNTEIRAVKKTA
jgi:hypothetical protein